MIDVCVVGSANLDLVATADRLPGPGETVLGVDFREHPGGKGLNQAVAAARAGGRVAFVGTVGRDDAGTQLRAVLGAESIDVEALDDVDGTPTGRALIVVDRRGENSIVVVPGANAATVAPHVAAARVLLTQLEVPLPAVAAAVGAARRAGTTTILNPAPASAGGLDPALLSAVDIIVPNEHEVQLLGGVEHLRALGVGAVIVTRGAHGVDVSSAGGRWHQPAFPVDVVDTTAAGDAFCGALAARLAAGHELRAAVCWAAAAGALATTVAGAVPSLPRREDIDALVSAAPAAPPSRRA